MENNGMEELRMLVTRLERLFDQQHGFNQDTNARFALMAERWDAIAARWDSYIVEQRQLNQRLQSILDRLPPPRRCQRRRDGAMSRGDTANPEPGAGHQFICRYYSDPISQCQ